MLKIRGDTVSVCYRQSDGTDPFGQPIITYSDPVAVDDVLVEPGAGKDDIESIRPDGIEITYTLRFPRTYDGPSLKNARISVHGRDCLVVGDPDVFTGTISPTRWNMNVYVQAVEG